MNGTYGNRTTNTFRRVNSVLFTLNQVFSFIFTGLLFILGIVFLVVSSVTYEGTFLFVYGLVFTLLSLLLFLPMGIVSGVLKKHNNSPTNKQFLALAIVCGLFGLYIEMAFCIVIYIFEGRNERRALANGEIIQ